MGVEGILKDGQGRCQELYRGQSLASLGSEHPRGLKVSGLRAATNDIHLACEKEKKEKRMSVRVRE